MRSGISQEELAWRAGLHRSYVADIERGVRNASLQSIEKLAKALKLSLSVLFEPLHENSLERTGASEEALGTILLVEHKAADADMTVRAFTQANVRNHIEVVSTKQAALDHLVAARKVEEGAEQGPQLVLIDLQLPDAGGLELLRAIKQDSRTAAIPVVMLTSLRSSRERQECQRLGAEIYIEKPVNFCDFCALAPKLSCYWGLFKLNEPAQRPSRRRKTDEQPL